LQNPVLRRVNTVTLCQTVTYWSLRCWQRLERSSLHGWLSSSAAGA